jgi:hypothetical protein
MRITYEDLLNDPSLFERLSAEAHRERAAAVHRLIVAPVTSFFADHAAKREPEACMTTSA